MPITSNATFLKLVGGMTACLFVIGLFLPRIRREDGVVEWATALTFLAAAAIAGRLAAKPGIPRNGLDRVAMTGLAAFALLLALSELSFGARIFGLNMPAMEGGGEFDGGHDVVNWTMRKIASATPATQKTLAVLAALGLAVAAIWAGRRRAWLHAAMRSFLDHPVRFRFLVSISLLACAVALDLLNRYPSGVLEEAMEFAASVALLTTVTAAVGSAESFTDWRHERRAIRTGAQLGRAGG